jgi:hypothetical protein
MLEGERSRIWISVVKIEDEDIREVKEKRMKMC